MIWMLGGYKGRWRESSGLFSSILPVRQLTPRAVAEDARAHNGAKAFRSRSVAIDATGTLLCDSQN
jgi:hypothetical protein